ncbi:MULTISPECIES: urea transporter [unclassified Caballeronia]|uniref:urea transporter n=1 Tax=unclassified Caballeronia TaxID=2646786 RepID=UPI002861E55D|nr:MULTISPECIES: urea transporter [unclassified Caballeronia]MDR5740350.1 urea transporter [Caballeronia sp. LZ016]MDR5808470.1 urea transporter [Caballeronia sp. LZ019]
MSLASHTDAAPGDSLLRFARSIGQIVLQRNAATGALLLAGVACASPRLACALVIGAIVGNVIAVITEDAGSPVIRDDLYGFNGALAALAAFTFIRDASQAAAVAILSAAFATLLAGRLTRILSLRALPIFSSPAIIVTWCWMPFLADRGEVGALGPVSSGGAALTKAAFAGLAPIVFASGAMAGAFIAAGLFAARPARAAWALAGSAIGAALHALCGASDAVVLSGACGFNAALAALATASLGARYAFIAMALAVSIERIADCIGIAALTAPFVLASWTAIAVARRIERTSKGESHVVHPHVRAQDR